MAALWEEWHNFSSSWICLQAKPFVIWFLTILIDVRWRQTGGWAKEKDMLQKSKPDWTLYFFVHLNPLESQDVKVFALFYEVD